MANGLNEFELSPIPYVIRSCYVPIVYLLSCYIWPMHGLHFTWRLHKENVLPIGKEALLVSEEGEHRKKN